MTINDAVLDVRNNMMAREPLFGVLLDDDYTDHQAIGNWLIAEACGDRYPEALGGDLLWYHIANISISGTGHMITFSLTYYDTYNENEAAIAQAAHYAASWGISNMTPADAVKTIYLNLARLCTYDSTSRIGNGYGRNSIYDVFVMHRAVCQGFANAMYYMCNQYVTPCRNIQGHELYDLALFSHMWNIIQLGTVWYYTDLTAAVHAHDSDPAIDDVSLQRWLMKTGQTFSGNPVDYLPLPNFERSEWRAMYPISATSYPY